MIYSYFRTKFKKKVKKIKKIFRYIYRGFNFFILTQKHIQLIVLTRYTKNIVCRTQKIRNSTFKHAFLRF